MEPCQAHGPCGTSPQRCSSWSRCATLLKFTYSDIWRWSAEPHCVLQVPQYPWSSVEGKPTISHLSNFVVIVETETGYQEQMSSGQLWEKPIFKWELYLIFTVFTLSVGSFPLGHLVNFVAKLSFQNMSTMRAGIVGHIHEVNLYRPFSTSAGSTSTGATHCGQKFPQQWVCMDQTQLTDVLLSASAFFIIYIFTHQFIWYLIF